MTLESRSFTVTGPPHVSVLFDLILARRPFQALTLATASSITRCVSGLPHISFKSSDEEKKVFFSLGSNGFP